MDVYLKTFVLLVAPYLPEWFAGWYADLYFSEDRVRSLVHNLQETLMLHHDAGVPIVMGTDNGGWPTC